MPNIFDGIAKLSDNDLRNQIATLEEVTMSNAFGQMGRTISNKTVTAFNAIRKTFTGQKKYVPPVLSIQDKIDQKSENLRRVNRAELEKRIRKVLIEKVNSATFHGLENPSDDELSVEVIELGVKCFNKEKINSNLTYAQKADSIRHRYDERMLSQMQEKLNNQTDEEKRQTEKAIQKEIDAMSDEKKEDLRRALNIEKINGEVVRKLLASTAGVSTAMIAMESAGFGAYIALTTIMHAIFTTFLGVTLPFAAYTSATSALALFTGPTGIIIAGGVELLMINKNKNKMIYELAAQVVWLSVTTYGKKFTPNEEELPSWLPSMERDSEIEKIKEVHKMFELEQKYKEQIEQTNRELSNAKNIILQNEEKIKQYERNEKKAREKYNREIAENKKLKEELESANKKHEEKKKDPQASLDEIDEAKRDYEKIKREFNRNEREIQELYDEMQRNLDEIDRLKVNNEKKEEIITGQDAKITSLEKELGEIKNKLDDKINNNAEELEKKWTKFFKTLDFDVKIFKQVVKNYEFNEFIDIEIKLREIDDAKDKGAVSDSRGKVGNGDYHAGFSTLSGYPSRVFYRKLDGSRNGKTAKITNICKHNDSRYEKYCR